MNIVSKNNPLKHYQWVNNCDGWNFVDENSLSVKLERMPAQTSEKKHFHENLRARIVAQGRAGFGPPLACRALPKMASST